MLVSVVGVLPSILFGAEDRDIEGLYVSSIERILKLPDEQIDIATAVLVLARDYGQNSNIRQVRYRIDDMAATLSQKFKSRNAHSDVEKIKLINSYLFDELNLKSVKTADDAQDLFVDSVLNRKQGYCLSLSVLYLSIAERLDLPVFGVVVPSHFFVRYQKGNIKFNIETTQKGVFLNDSYYIEQFKVPTGSYEGIYLKNLTCKQTIGCFLNNLANIYFQQNRLDEAMDYQQTALRINPGLAESHVNLGNIYFKKTDYQQALFHFREAASINPNDSKTHFNIANTYHKLEQKDSAIGEYMLSLKLDPNYIDTYRNLALVYQQNNLSQKAVETVKRAMALVPADCNLNSQLGDIYLQAENYESAIYYYQYALMLEPSLVGANNGLAYAYLKSERTDEAVVQFRTTLFYGPDYVPAYFGLAAAYEKLKFVDEQIQTYRQLLAIEPKNTASLFNLGNVYLSQQDYSQAEQIYRRAVKAGLETEQVYHNLGLTFSYRQQHSKAKELYLTAIEIKYDYPIAHNNLAISLYNLGEYDDALKHARIARQLGFEVSDEFIEQIIRKTD